jgi:uncharacterized protein (DUF1697 family)
LNTYIALFHGINVGGKNIIKTKELVSLLETLGAKQVKTYIQSGNVILESTNDPSRLSSADTCAPGAGKDHTPH